VVNQAVEKCVTGVDHDASGCENDRREVRAALRRGLRTSCNRRRNSARLLDYRTLGVYVDGDVLETSLQRVVVATNPGNAMVADAAVAVPGTASTGYRLKVKDSDREMERALDMNGAAASIFGELLLLEPGQLWKSVREACAACLKRYADATEYPKFLRPESLEARKGVVRCMRDELRDLKAVDIDLSDKEADEIPRATRDDTPAVHAARPALWLGAHTAWSQRDRS